MRPDRLDTLSRRLGAAAERRSAVAAEGFAEHAGAAGLLDVAYARTDSPLGELLLAATESGVVRLAYLAETSEERVLGELATRVSPRLLEAPARLDAVRRELDEYFEGRRRRFDAPVDRRLATGFNRAVLEAISELGYGETASYAEVARRAGSPAAHRATGNALNRNPVPVIVPCHRVLRTGGGLGGYAGGTGAKERLLQLEGVL
ncbi:MAG TPA: methylated-DNA--[protein]-cysteine S-methyltransferase [Thermoleophilaceae bacterium]|nr:methylated-DNA--[protein]-cysteine S-methyltransferase [Thermoleophilaceae bacterium]